jgi:serine/threonine protein kinase
MTPLSRLSARRRQGSIRGGIFRNTMHVPQTEVILRHDGTELARVTLPPGEYVIGRNPDVEIFADTPLISRRHAQLTINYDHLLIEDLGSSNGTFVNEQPIAEATRLYPNQAVRLGDVTVELHRERAPSEPGVSLAPAQAAIRRFLPDELLAEKRYAVGSQIARGGMGAILDARQMATQRTVAMKVMLGSGDEGDVLRFIEEAQVTAQLDHPNIVPVYELGVDEQDQLFYTMKLVRGITLKKVLELLAQGIPETVKKFPLPALLTIFQKVCDAVAFAHAKGVIHRDLKPENLMLGDFGSVLVMDWGLAKVVGGSSQSRAGAEAGLGSPAHMGRSFVMSARAGVPDSGSTLSGTIMGTPQYMAPEQARGEVETLDARADIYALGAILFEILYLRPTVTGADAMEIVGKVERGEIAWEAKRNARVPESLLAICHKALALDKARRYPRVEDLQADVLAYQNGFLTSAEKAGWFRRAYLAVRRNKTASLATVLILLSGAGFGTNAILAGQRANRALAELRRTAPTFAAQAQSLVEQHRFDEALTTLATACTLDPEHAEFHVQRGHIHQTLLHFDDARAAYREALRRAPQHTGAKHNLALTESLARETAEGSEQAKRAQARLQSELTQQGRTAEAVYLSKDLAGDGARNFATWEPVVRKLGLKLDTPHFRARSDGTLFLVIEDHSFSDLRPFRGMPLGELVIARTAVTDLSPLKGMPLARLSIAANPQITDISVLQHLPLDSLDMGSTGVTDLAPLRGLKLVELIATRADVKFFTDLSPLAGMPLERLSIAVDKEANPSVLAGMRLTRATFFGNLNSSLRLFRGMPLVYLRVESEVVDDLRPLRGLPLETLALDRARIADLSPLRDLPALRDLRLQRMNIADLSPLGGLPLKSLYLDDCKQVRDLRPLTSLTSLEMLVIPQRDFDLTPLRQMPSLKRLSYRFMGLQPAHTVEEFWREYDAPQAAGKK